MKIYKINVALSYTFLILLLRLKLVNCEMKIVPFVTIDEGTLRGTTMTSRSGQKFSAFEGIRYGSVERFKVAKPSERWEGVKDATEFGSECAYMLPGEMSEFLGLRGSEDCLYLNVYTPSVSTRQPLPVMFWIHGGGFVLGSGGLFGPQYILDEEVILVTINYRLGIFGFLYTEDDAIPGNLGLRDMVLALHWVRRNIRYFGGDPNLVTVFGESAGAFSVNLLILSPMTEGLIHRAIVMSGNIGAYVYSRIPRLHAERFGAKNGCYPDNGNYSVMVECLKKIDTEALIEAQITSMWGPVPDYHWGPVVERVSVEGNKYGYFLNEKPEEMLAQGKVRKEIPLIIGFMKNEGGSLFAGMILNDEEWTVELNANWSSIAPYMFLFYDEKLALTEKTNLISSKIRQFYFGNLEINLATEQRLCDVFSDRYFIHGTRNTAFAFARAGVSVYSYVFTFDDGHGFMGMMGGPTLDETPNHGDDLQYLFPTLLRMSLSSVREHTFSRNLVRLFASFAKTGNVEETWENVTWPPLHPESTAIPFFKIDTVPQILPDKYQTRSQFWNDLLQNETFL